MPWPAGAVQVILVTAFVIVSSPFTIGFGRSCVVATAVHPATGTKSAYTNG
jgi:hypothetical protein